MKKIIVLIAPLILGSCSKEKNINEQKQNAFYQSFRKSFLKKDFLALASISRFPIQIHGRYDEHPILNLSKENFLNCFSLIYDEYSGINEQKHFDYLESEVNRPSKNNPFNPAWFRVGNLHFEKNDDGNYQLTIFYLDTEDSLVQKKCS